MGEGRVVIGGWSEEGNDTKNRERKEIERKEILNGFGG